ncbi:MAG: DUF885 family protein [Pseudomonadota bacterium]
MRSRPLVLIVLLVGTLSLADDETGTHFAGMPTGKLGYTAFVGFWDNYLHWQNPALAKKDKSLVDVAGETQRVHPDFGSSAMAGRLAELQTFQRKLEDFAVHTWGVSQQIEFLAVRAKLHQEEFRLRVSRPWARDPGFYTDRFLRLTFTELPVEGQRRIDLERQLNAVPELAAQAKDNLTDVAADYADLAIFNLSNSDGVGHGFPYRADPPAGILGWYDDLLTRAEIEQPDLVDDINGAKAAVSSLNNWLIDNRKSMTADAGVGEAAFDWYLKHVKLMPYTSAEIITLGERELDRLWGLYALERHRNRRLPEIALPVSREEYQQRIDDTDARIRAFLEDNDIISIPPFIGFLSTNVPWIVREGGPNFWEQIQFRNPTPDHLHAVIPGHRFDAVVERNNTHPIRSRLTFDARVEGWGVYLEEAVMNAGLLDEQPRVRELIYLFGIFRAARMPADVWLQTNVMSADEVADYWMENVPYLDRDVARVDAEIYLRRPPGYGLGYTAGMLQVQTLLAQARRQHGDDFSLREFHDAFLQAGRLPLSLIHYEMTGDDRDMAYLWREEPLFN